MLELNDIKETIFVKDGTPQGGIISVLGWNVPFDQFLHLFDDTAVTVVGFADDGILLVTDCDLPTMTSIMQQALNKAVSWGHSRRLSFSTEKTQLVHFTHKRKFV